MSPRSHSASTVLVVDDDPSVLATYGRLLKRAGYRTVIQGCPRSVLENGHARGVELLLIDYKMPAMDGLTLLAELRRRDCRARCILISAFVTEDVRCQARNLGVDLVLDKPVDVRTLRSAIENLLPSRPNPASTERAAG